MGVKSYKKDGRTVYKIDTWLDQPDGTRKRKRISNIPTIAQAQALERKAKSEAFEKRWFEREPESKLTVEQAWKNYEPVVERKRSFRTAKSAAKRLLRHLGNKKVMKLTARNIDEYRTKRDAEITNRKGKPKPATLDAEVELLKRFLNYAALCGEIPHNPIAKVKLLNVPNARRVWLDDDKFETLLKAADESFRPVMVLAFETGMRKSEITNLKWNQIGIKEGVIQLSAQDTKNGKARNVYLTHRALEVIKSQPRSLTGYVFINPKTGKQWTSIHEPFSKARTDAGMKEVVFHDLRRSFITRARKKGIPESVIMRMSGHLSRNVFDRYNVTSDDDILNAVGVLNEESPCAATGGLS